MQHLFLSVTNLKTLYSRCSILYYDVVFLSIHLFSTTLPLRGLRKGCLSGNQASLSWSNLTAPKSFRNDSAQFLCIRSHFTMFLTTFQLWTVFSRFFFSYMFWYVFCQCDLEKTLNTLRSLLGEFKVREHIRLTSERARGIEWCMEWCNDSDDAIGPVFWQVKMYELVPSWQPRNFDLASFIDLMQCMDRRCHATRFVF